MWSRVLQHSESKKRDTVRSSEVRIDIVHMLLMGNSSLVPGLNESESQVGIRLWTCSYITLSGTCQRNPRRRKKKNLQEPFDDALCFTSTAEPIFFQLTPDLFLFFVCVNIPYLWSEHSTPLQCHQISRTAPSGDQLFTSNNTDLFLSNHEQSRFK